VPIWPAEHFNYRGWLHQIVIFSYLHQISQNPSTFTFPCSQRWSLQCIQFNEGLRTGTVTTASSGRAIPASTHSLAALSPPAHTYAYPRHEIFKASTWADGHIQRGPRITLTRGSTSTPLQDGSGSGSGRGTTRRRRYRSMAAGEGRVSVGGWHHVPRVGTSIGRVRALRPAPRPRASW
jgi:hypothetical protein